MIFVSGPSSQCERPAAIEDVQGRAPQSPPLPPSSLPHSCQLCGKMISCRRNLWKHMERVHFTNPAVRCSLCSKMFKNKYALKDHQRIYHGGLSEPPPGGPAPLLSRILHPPFATPPEEVAYSGPMMGPPPMAGRPRPPLRQIAPHLRDTTWIGSSSSTW